MSENQHEFGGGASFHGNVVVSGNLSIGDIPMVFAAVAVPAGWFVTQFAGSIAKGLGDDTYRVLKKNIVSWWLAQTKRDARFADNPDALDRIAVRLEPELKGQTDTVALPAAVEDPGNAALVQVDPDLPREAFVALAQVDWSTQPGGTYRFDSKTGRWKL